MLKKEFNLNDLVKGSEKDYNQKIKEIKLELIKDFKNSRKEFTYKTEKFKTNFLKDKIVTVYVDGDQYEMSYGNFLTLLITFKIFNKFYNNGKQDYFENLEDFLYDPSDLNQYDMFFNLVYQRFIGYPTIKSVILECLSELTNLTQHFVSGTTSLYSIIQIMINNPEFDKLVHYEVDESKPVSQIISDIKANMEKIKEFLVNTDNENRDFILAGDCINLKQMSQVLNCIGNKPNELGDIDPHTVNTNFVRGLRDVEDFLVIARGSRKALNTNASKVKDSGYLTRKTSLLTLDSFLNGIEKCNTPKENYVRVKIKNIDVLSRYENRYYYDEETKSLQVVGKNEKLIGKTLLVPSPITCSCKEGICNTCYGELSKTNKGENIGLIATLLLTEILTQMLLSTKHLLEANMEKVDWGDDFESNFSVAGNKIFYNDDKLKLSNIRMFIDEEKETISEIHLGKAVIKPTLDLFVNPIYSLEFDDEKGFYYINSTPDELDDIEEKDLYVFTVKLKNKELSEPLLKLKDLIDSDDIKERNIDDNVEYFLYLLRESKINLSSEHMEVLLRELLVVEDRSFFENIIDKTVEFCKTSTTVMNSPLSKSLLFENLKAQLLNPKTYYKTGSTALDYLL